MTGVQTCALPISTGNYNESTARLYTDYHLLSTSPELGEDIRTFFTWLQIGDIDAFRQPLNMMVTSPFTFKQAILKHIHQEIESHIRYGDGHIIFKMNSMTDKDIMQALILADEQGVNVELLIRGINCLDSHGTKIKIRSILGRFLEHSRVYYFRHHQDPYMLISSADLMTRNTMKRIESATVIKDDNIINSILESLLLQLRDDIECFDLVNHQYSFKQGIDVQRLHMNLPSMNIEINEGFMKRIMKKLTNLKKR